MKVVSTVIYFIFLKYMRAIFILKCIIVFLCVCVDYLRIRLLLVSNLVIYLSYIYVVF